MNIKIKNFSIDIFYDVIAAVAYSAGIYVFAQNANFAMGGVSGLSLVINYLFHTPLGMTALALNIPVALLCFKILGTKFMLKTFKTLIVLTVMIDFVFPYFPQYEGSPLIASVFAGALIGAGCGLVYVRGSSTGGTDFLTLSMKKLFPHFSLGQIIFAIDAVIILSGSIVFNNIDAVLYGVISTFVASLTVDKITYGAGSGKMALIITDYGKEVSSEISKQVDRGSTILDVTGSYSGKKKNMVICACSRDEIFKVRSAATDIDKKALIMITEANEVLGEGFTIHDEKNKII